jgi:protein-S-isoprenylcysteine O-methyltransferase Ste14
VIRNGIIFAWMVIGLVWLVGATRGKRTTRRENAFQRLTHVAGTAVAILLITQPCHFWSLDVRVLPQTLPGDGIGFVLSLAGIGFAIWARVLLGTNWSGMVTVKEGHELMRSGPYAIVRHPIYTGALVGMAGTAIVWGEVRCFLAVAIAAATFWRKLQVEEIFLTEVFGEQYRRYRREVRALVPWL